MNEDNSNSSSFYREYSLLFSYKCEALKNYVLLWSKPYHPTLVVVRGCGKWGVCEMIKVQHLFVTINFTFQASKVASYITGVRYNYLSTTNVPGTANALSIANAHSSANSLNCSNVPGAANVPSIDIAVLILLKVLMFLTQLMFQASLMLICS